MTLFLCKISVSLWKVVRFPTSQSSPNSLFNTFGEDKYIRLWPKIKAELGWRNQIIRGRLSRKLRMDRAADWSNLTERNNFFFFLRYKSYPMKWFFFIIETEGVWWNEFLLLSLLRQKVQIRLDWASLSKTT